MSRRAPLLLSVLLLAVSGAVLPAAADDDRAPGIDPLSAGPAYVFSDMGAALSDDGSHYCFKDEVDSPDLLRMMTHGCRTAWGMPGLRLGEMWWDLAGATTTGRHVTWHPWGWQETASAGGLQVIGRTYFTGTDALVSTVTLSNVSDHPATVTPRVLLHGGPSWYDARDKAASVFLDAQAAVEDGAVRLTTTSPMAAVGSTAGPTPGLYAETRVLRTSPAIGALAFSTSAAQDGHTASRTYDGTMTLLPATVPAHGSTTMRVVSGWARDETPQEQVGVGLLGDGAMRAKTLADKADAALRDDPTDGFDRVERSWRRYLERLDLPDDATPEQQRLAYLAATALRQNWYAPINKMPGGSVVPEKAFYDGFYGWDTPYNAIGLSHTDVGQAEEALVTQLSVPTVTGAVPGVFGDDMQAWSHTQGPSVPVAYDDTQAPTQGLAVLRLLERDHDDARRARFVAAVRGPIDRYVAWWQHNRDVNHDLLVEVGANDDASFNSSSSTDQFLYPAKAVAPVLYNAYYNVLLQAAAALAEAQHDDAAASSYRQQALAHTKAMNTIMWDEATHRWHTVTSTPGVLGSYTQDPVDTVDAGLVALYAAGQDPVKAREYVEHELLDPKKFFGTYPFPTTAYDDPAYSPGGGFSGKLWLNEAEPMLELLWRYGYHAQANVAAQRLTAMLAQNPNGIYEGYNSQNGNGVRFWQFSWSSTFALELLTRTWQQSADVQGQRGSDA